MTEKRGRGQPPFKPTPMLRQDVRLFKADGWSDDRIARRLGISRNTLTKYFGDELANGADQERQDALRLLKKAARKLNVTAIRELLKIIGVGASAEQFLAAVERPAREPKLGKKEQAIADAQQPDTTTELGRLMAQRGALH